MRSISITNFGPIARADLNLDGIVIIKGQHGAGKSMVMEALTLSLYGKFNRVKRKTDLPDLIRTGAKDSTIAVEWDDTKRKVVIKPSTKTCQSVDIPNEASMQADDPWAHLSINPATWRRMLPTSTLDKDKLAKMLQDFPPAISNLCLAYADKGLEELITKLEEERLSAHRGIVDPPEVRSTETICGVEVHLPTYLPHLSEYITLANNTYKQMADYEAYRSDRDSALKTISEVKERLAAVTTKLRAVRKYTTPTVRQQLLAIDVKLAQIQGKSVCEYCGQSIETEEETTLFATRSKILSLAQNCVSKHDRQGLLDYIKTVRQARTAALDKLTMPEVSPPESIEQWNGLIVALKAYSMAVDAQKKVLTTNESCRELRTNLQAAIALLRRPETAGELVSASIIEAVKNRLGESCEVLGIPKVTLSDSFETVFTMGDGSIRGCSLLSDAQRAMAGLAIAEAVAFATKKVDFLLVDKLDWVEGDHVGRLSSFLKRAAGWAKTVVVLTAKEGFAVPSALVYAAKVELGGTVFVQQGTV